MIIGFNASGNVLLVGEGSDVESMPTRWNGIALTAYVLTPEQRELVLASPNRGGLMWDGTTLAVLPPVPPQPPDPRVVEDEAQREACKADGVMIALINQTRAEWATWAQNNFPTLTIGERTRMGVICWLLAVAIRRLMR